MRATVVGKSNLIPVSPSPVSIMLCPIKSFLLHFKRQISSRASNPSVVAFCFKCCPQSFNSCLHTSKLGNLSKG